MAGLCAWLLVFGALLAARLLDASATTWVYLACLVVPPFLIARRRDRLGLGAGDLRLSLLVFAGLSLLTLPAYVVYTGGLRAPEFTQAVALAAAALPEEFFFRGFLQGGWARAAKARVRVLGAEVGWEWFAASAAFAVTHVVFQGAWGLLTFFPGLLFGWAYARTGTIWTSVLYHAACNIVFLSTG